MSQRRNRAAVFAALGDDTRLALVGRLSQGEPCSIAALTVGTTLTRQGVTKHLRVLQAAGLLSCSRQGRETVFRLEPEPLAAAREYLDQVSRQWDVVLARLKAHVEATASSL